MPLEKLKHTARGFALREFKDANGVPCNMQISSGIRDNGEKLLWLGAAETGMQVFVPHQSWTPVTDAEIAARFGAKMCCANNRMHLTQSQVKELLPYLQKFAETGSLK